MGVECKVEGFARVRCPDCHHPLSLGPLVR